MPDGRADDFVFIDIGTVAKRLARLRRISVKEAMRIVREQGMPAELSGSFGGGGGGWSVRLPADPLFDSRRRIWEE